MWTELGRLRSGLQWAQKRRIIQAAPYVWMPSQSPPRERVLTEDELIALIDGCNMPHVRLFVILALCTAGRRTALLELTWDRVDFAKGSIDLRKPSKVEKILKTSRKGRAIVSMNGLARAALSEAATGRLTDHVIEWNGSPLASIKTGFSAAVKRADLTGVTPHTLRHTAATMAWNQDVDPQKVARFLGHKNARTTYAPFLSQVRNRASRHRSITKCVPQMIASASQLCVINRKGSVYVIACTAAAACCLVFSVAIQCDWRM